jgi:hypothetical protein
LETHCCRFEIPQVEERGLGECGGFLRHLPVGVAGVAARLFVEEAVLGVEVR